MVSHMIKIGEETGELEKMLGKVVQTSTRTKSIRRSRR